MRYVKYKVFLVTGHEKEEQWLNEMSAEGLQLVSVGFCRYVFEEGPPDKYTYRLELLENMPSHPKSRAYIRFVEEAGVDCVASLFRWVYFRKPNDGTPFQLFSDIPSKLKHYGRIRGLCVAVCALNLAVGISNISMYYSSLQQTAHNEAFVGNISLGSTNIALAALLAIGALQITKRICRLKKEKAIHE